MADVDKSDNFSEILRLRNFKSNLLILKALNQALRFSVEGIYLAKVRYTVFITGISTLYIYLYFPTSKSTNV